MGKHTMQELLQWQALPLSVKVLMTKERIREWIHEYGEDGVYVSFSGGKDSTVLLDIVRQDYPDVPAVFVDTGLEFPEIREFVKTFENVVIVKPEMTFRQVIDKYGYPFISKEISDAVSMARRGYKSGMDKLNGLDKNGNVSEFRKGCMKWKFLIDAPFKISDECCYINKKNPAKNYEHKTHRKPMVATMTSESAMRQNSWLRTGCNSYDSDRPISTPMAFWTDTDVLQYIKEHELKMASVYGNIVYEDSNGMQYDDILPFCEDLKLTTSGYKRTGCMFCAYGIHCAKDNKFIRMKETHPKVYDYIMRPLEQGGLNYKEIIDWVNEHGKLNIKY